MSTPPVIRAYQHADHVAIATIFCRAVHEIACKDYTPAQCAAWSDTKPNPQHWEKRCERKQPFVSVVNDEIAGFLELDPDGHIDCAYVNPDFQRRGIMTGLVQHASEVVKVMNLPRLYLEASIGARCLFERLGFQVLAEREVAIGEQRLVNYRVEAHAGSTIAYRQLRTDDIPALERMVDAELFRDPGLWEPAGVRTGWVACSDDVPVAVSLASRHSGEVLALAVQPEFRGNRIGRELLRQAAAWLFSHGWETITWVGGSEFLLQQGWQGGEEGRWIKANEKPAFTLEEHWVEDPSTGYARLVRLSRGPADRPHPLCLILDGELYWRDLDAVPIFERVADSMPSGVTFAYVGHVSALDRHRDFTANEDYACFIGERVIPWLQQEVEGLSDSGHAVVGLSLSGLMAVHLALRYPRLFSACVSQSGSHWWDYESFGETVKRRAPVRGRFWLSVGSHETQTDVRHPPTGLHQQVSQVEGVSNAVRVLREAGGVVNVHGFEGGHARECWRDELEEAVRWALDLTPSARE